MNVQGNDDDNVCSSVTFFFSVRSLFYQHLQAAPLLLFHSVLFHSLLFLCALFS